CALEKGSGLVCQNAQTLSVLYSGTNHAERRTITGSGERAGVAMGEDGSGVRQQFLTEVSHALVVFNVFVMYCQSFANKPVDDGVFRGVFLNGSIERVFHSLDCPKQIDGCWPRSREDLSNPLELRPQFVDV